MPKKTVTARAPKGGLDLDVSGSPEEQVVKASSSTLSRVFGAYDEALNKSLLEQLLQSLDRNEASDGTGYDRRYFMCASVADIAPRDGVERMLAVQMAATHAAMMRAARWLAGAETLRHVEAYGSAFNKLARTYTAQVEALRKHRTGGEQTVRVEHVTVEAGAQAIVGNVSAGGRGSDEK